jgi:GDSL-like Lipase/Acylhydrolase family
LGETHPMNARKVVVLLGDSIIDNGAYVGSGEPDVAQQLEMLLPHHTLVKRAVDGSTCADVHGWQLGDLHDAGRVILSVGGNDALQHIDLLEAATETTARDVLVRLWSIREEFRRSYAALLDRLALTRRPVLVLTVYNPCFHGHGFDTAYQQAAESAVSIINDVIQQEGRHRSFDILELRNLFNGQEDYANPIELSAVGGAKLAKCMSDWVGRPAERTQPAGAPVNTHSRSAALRRGSG